MNLLFSVCLFTFASVVVTGTKLQRFDGWYNNLLHPHWGAVGQPLARNVTTVYSDEVFLPSGINRPNPRRLSNELFIPGLNNVAIANVSNRTALFAHFSHLVQLEILHADEAGCPVELLKVKVPRGDQFFDSNANGDENLPYERLAYDKTTGQSPNNPRRQINPTSSFIDGSFVYGTSSVRNERLRERGSGKLACQYRFSFYPSVNDIDLPYHTLSYANKKQDPRKLWRLGDTHAFETPPLLSLSLLFFNYHNRIAGIASVNGRTSQESFDVARRWVIATLQKIVVYDWLPLLTGVQLPPYSGYKSWVQPDVTDIFDAGAINYILTLIPSAIKQLDKDCKLVLNKQSKSERLCNTYWDAMHTLYSRPRATEEFLLGLAKQRAENDDLFIVEDLRSKFYGPLYHSRQDAVVQVIMKGRDYGLPDYNTVRAKVGLPIITEWEDINPWLNETHPEVIKKFKDIHYRNLSNIDLFVGGMMETTPSGPGPTFTRIIMDQFIRIRDGDRFWFENTENRLFSEDEIEKINQTTLADIIVNITGLKMTQLQEDVFTIPKFDNNSACDRDFSIPEEDLEICPPHHGYDFFKGSEIPYIIIWTCLGLLPFLCVFAAYLLAKCKQWRHKRRIKELELEKEKKRILRRTLSCSVSVHDAVEWRGNQTPRAVELHITTRGCIEVFSATGKHLRSIKVENMSILAVKSSINKKRNVLMIAMPREYDLVLEFPSEPLRTDFESVLNQLASSFNVGFSLMELRLQDIYSSATTKEKRNKMLEKFFKIIFSEAFEMDYDPSLDNGAQLDMKRQSEEILEIELSKDEFAEAMAVKANSDFVEHFFSMIDSDRNGYISFREFLNAVVLFSKGSTHDKLQTMFYMYDIDGTGYMSKKQMGQMFKSLLELAQSQLGHDDAEILVDSLCEQAGVEKKDDFTLENFCQLLSPEMNKLSNVSFEWKGVSKVIPSKLKSGLKKGHASDGDIRHRANGTVSVSETNGTSHSHRRFEAIREKYSPLKARVKLVKHFFENYRSHIFILTLFYGICVGLFIERFYYYTFEQESAGYRKLMSYGISVTRGAAASMSFTFSFLLLTMCRNTITFFRNTMLNLFIPFDSHVSFHKVMAWSALFFSAMHIIGYSFNFYHLVTQPTEFLCIFKSLYFRHTAPTFQWWLFSTMTGFTGVLLVLVLCILFTFATQTARRYIFDWFWLTHKLFIILYVLTIIHGVSTVVQKPLFFAYFVGPAIWFTIDKVVSLCRKKKQNLHFEGTKFAIRCDYD